MIIRLRNQLDQVKAGSAPCLFRCGFLTENTTSGAPRRPVAPISLCYNNILLKQVMLMGPRSCRNSRMHHPRLNEELKPLITLFTKVPCLGTVTLRNGDTQWRG